MAMKLDEGIGEGDYTFVVEKSGLKRVIILNPVVTIAELKEVAAQQFPGVPEGKLQIEVSDDSHYLIVLVAIN